MLYTVDDHSTYAYCVAMKQKSASECESAMKKLVSHYNTYGHKVQKIMSDHEAVFKSINAPIGLLGVKVVHTPAGMS